MPAKSQGYKPRKHGHSFPSIFFKNLFANYCIKTFSHTAREQTEQNSTVHVLTKSNDFLETVMNDSTDSKKHSMEKWMLNFNLKYTILLDCWMQYTGIIWFWNISKKINLKKIIWKNTVKVNTDIPVKYRCAYRYTYTVDHNLTLIFFYSCILVLTDTYFPSMLYLQDLQPT